MQRIDLTGQKFGSLTAEFFIGSINYSHHRYWQCVCDCGTETKVTVSNLRQGKVQSCGCSRGLLPAEWSQTPEYGAWCNMRYRCDNPLDKDYVNYGARGIKYDPSWASFLQFAADMGHRPQPHPTEGTYTLERLDNNGPYCKANCIWATRTDQNRNSRNTKHLRAS